MQMNAAVPVKSAHRSIRTARATRTFPAIIGEMGPRLVTFSTQISPFDLVDILGHDPRSEKHAQLADAELRRIYDVVQRKTTRGRRDAIIDYINRQMFDGDLVAGLPAISIASQNPITFQEIEGGATGGVGQMALETGRNNRRIVIDGLARISGVLAVVDMALGDSNVSASERSELIQNLEQFTLPVVFYAPREGAPGLAVADLGQLFADFNFKVTPVSAKDAIALDMSDPYIQATRYLADNVHAIQFHGGMQLRAATLGKKATGIVAQPILLRFARAALEGEASVEAGRNSRIENPRLTRESRDRLLPALGDFVDDLATAMGERWAARNGLHLTSAGWQAIGVLYHDVTVRLTGVDTQKFAQALGELDWSRSAPLWSNLVVEKTRSDGTKEMVLRGAGATARRELIKTLRERFKLTERLQGRASD